MTWRKWLGLAGVGVLLVGLGLYSDTVDSADDMTDGAWVMQVEPSATVGFGSTPIRTATQTPTIGFGGTAGPTRTASRTPSPSATSQVLPSATLGTPTMTFTPRPTSIYQELRALQLDPDFVLRFRLDATCYEADHEVTGVLSVRNLKDTPFYLYLGGQIMFSINDSPLLPDFPPNEPTSRDDFFILEPNAEIVLLEIEDVGLYVQGMGPDSGIDFFETETVYGLPVGDYWVTAGYSNPHSGLRQQIDRTYLIPEAAWRGVAVSRELRFSVVEDLDECPSGIQ